MEFLKSNWEISCLVGLLIITLVFVVVSFSISKSKDNSYISAILRQANTVRTFTIDYENNRVTYFNLSDIQNVRYMSTEEFFKQYPESNGTKVMKWLDAVLKENTDAPDTLETIVILTSQKKPLYVLLKVDSVNYQTKIIHLSSYLLKKSADTDAFISKRKVITSKSAVLKILNRQRRSNGFTLNFKFAYCLTSQANNEIDPLIFGNFKNFFFEHLINSRYLLENDGNSISLIDTNCKQVQFVAEQISSSIRNGIQKYLSLNGLEGDIEIFVGGVDHSLFKTNKDQIFIEASNCSEFAHAENKKDQILWYSKGRRISGVGLESSFRTEVEKIISSNRLKNKFRMIFDVNKMRPYGFLSKTFVNDNFFQDINDLRDYAYRSGDSKELVASLTKKIIPTFINQRLNPSDILFFPCRIDEKSYLLATLSSLVYLTDVSITILFSEDDISQKLAFSKDEEVIENLKIVKSRGFSIGLNVTEEGLSLTDNFYSIFDNFVVNFTAGSSGVSIDNEIRASLHTLVEKLIKYKKPIICNDLEGFDAIELLVRSGLTYICSESLSPFNQMILRPDPKIVNKIQKMKG